VPRTELDTPKVRVTTETWDAWSTTRLGETSGRVLSITFPTAAARRRWEALGRPNLRPGLPGPAGIEPSELIPVGHTSLTLRQLTRLPDDANLLYRRLFANGTASEALDDVGTSLDLYPISSGLRAAIYRALALVPGIHFAGHARTLTNHTGEVLAARDPGGIVEDELIIDPSTGATIASRTVVIDAHATGLPVGTTYSETDIVQQAVTNTPRPPRS
jgi:hypothetical protein